MTRIAPALDEAGALVLPASIADLPLTAVLPEDEEDRSRAAQQILVLRRLAAEGLAELEGSGAWYETQLLTGCARLQVGQADLAIALYTAILDRTRRNLCSGIGCFFEFPIPILNSLHGFIEYHGTTSLRGEWVTLRPIPPSRDRVRPPAP